jgi:hypothetical protein
MTAEAALALVMTAGDIRTVLALPLSKAKPLSRLDSLGESNIILSGCVTGLVPGVAPVDLVQHGLYVLVACVEEEVKGTAVKEAEELEEDGRM